MNLVNSILSQVFKSKVKACSSLMEKNSDLTSLIRSVVFPQKIPGSCKMKKQTLCASKFMHAMLCARRPGVSLASQLHLSSIGRTGNINWTPQEPSQHTPAPAGKILWLDIIKLACTKVLSFWVYLSVKFFKPSWKQGYKGVQRLTWTLAIFVLLHETRSRTEVGVTFTAAGLAAGHKTHTPPDSN